MLRPRDGLLQRSSTRVRKNHQWLCPSWTDRDFNAHLGSLGGVRGTSNPNLQGILLSDIMDRHNLCAVCQCEWANGPLYTYVSGNSMTTVDYIFTSVNATSITSSCKTLPMTDLNLSDHLPLVAELTIEYPVQTQPDACNNHHPWLDWEQATKSEEINDYRGLWSNNCLS